MPHQFYVFNTPAGVPILPGTRVTLAHDTGWGGTAVPSIDPDGRHGVVVDLPDTVPAGQGAQINLEADGKVPLEARGVLVYPNATRAYLQCDDFRMTDLPVAPEPEPEPPPTPSWSTPLEVINGVYATGLYNLATKTGCGQFTEECCRQLAALWGGPPWGHVAKAPGQNQFQAHAVDAVHSLYGSDHGIWDIITSSVSTSARPAFNRAGNADPELWRPPAPLPCLPAGTATRAVQLTVTLSLEDLIRVLAVARVI